MKKSLDLGCGENPRNPYNADVVVGIDVSGEAGPFRLVRDVAMQGIPFPEDYFDYVSAYDFLEHIPRLVYLPDHASIPRIHYPFVDLMSEIWRVLKPDGIFYSSTPCAHYAAAFQDPTHVNYVTPDTFGEYFDDQKTWAKHYGFKGKFKIVTLEMTPPHLKAVLKAVKSG